MSSVAMRSRKNESTSTWRRSSSSPVFSTSRMPSDQRLFAQRMNSSMMDMMVCSSTRCIVSS